MAGLTNQVLVWDSQAGTPLPLRLCFLTMHIVLLHPHILMKFDLVQVIRKDPQGCLWHGILGAMPLKPFSLPHILVADLQYGLGMGWEWESVPTSRESQYDPEDGM